LRGNRPPDPPPDSRRGNLRPHRPDTMAGAREVVWLRRVAVRLARRKRQLKNIARDQSKPHLRSKLVRSSGPIAPLNKNSPPIAQRGPSFSVIAARHKVIYHFSPLPCVAFLCDRAIQ
jgi:hypothetical protein